MTMSSFRPVPTVKAGNLNSRNCTSEDLGNSYGCGWNGVSGTWLQEGVDISAYAGGK